MPYTSRSNFKHFAVGFGLSGVLMALLLLFNIAGLRNVIAGTGLGWILGLLVWIGNGIAFGFVQLALSINDDDDEDDHHGGRRSRDMERDHAVVRVPVDQRRGPF